MTGDLLLDFFLFLFIFVVVIVAGEIHTKNYMCGFRWRHFLTHISLCSVSFVVEIVIYSPFFFTYGNIAYEMTSNLMTNLNRLAFYSLSITEIAAINLTSFTSLGLTILHVSCVV